MINEKICKLRDELNKSISEGQNYEVIYELSVKLDEVIAEYYKEIAQN
ncbi:MAG: aspartyl-phosphate phosphatase Spo0E family protein [Clostridia bacterium]|nr:aspartyl-phosphate phosphatase Spo0E family protein [Clostridia bacterium]MBR3152487.1 aspartyl-phosphate phosphatase Spo0E family protein [Clostridia bacterium]